MNEVMNRRHVKKVMSYGIPKLMATEIVDTAMDASKDNNVEVYINYAIDLVYGMGFTKKFAKQNC